MITTTRRADYRALAQFRYELRRFLRFSEDAARTVGLEPQHHQMLLVIKGAPADADPSIAYVAEQLQLKHNSVVGLADRLEANGLIERRRAPDDHRRVQVRLTAAGEHVLHDLSLEHQEEIRLRAPELIAAMVAIVRAANKAR